MEKWPETLKAMLEIYALFNPFVFLLVATSRILNIELLIIYPWLWYKILCVQEKSDKRGKHKG